MMRVRALTFLMALLVSVSLCWADEAALKDAYALYYKGDKETAIELIEEYVKDNPDAGAYYFLGYAYYEKQEMDRANEYFKEAFSLKDFYSPLPEEKDQ